MEEESYVTITIQFKDGTRQKYRVGQNQASLSASTQFLEISDPNNEANMFFINKDSIALVIVGYDGEPISSA